MKKWISYVLGVLFVLSFMIALLFTSIELAAFTDMNFYRDQYSKNDVYADVHISEDDLIHVTKHLLQYTKGKTDDLVVYGEIDGQVTEFFNQREKDHMEDVRNLVVGAIYLGRALVVVMVVILFVLYRMKLNIFDVLSRAIVFAVPVIVLIGVTLGILIAQDFTEAFIVFHELLFTNDLWWLNPTTDRLINIVPEPFFSAVTLRIGVLYGTFVGIIYVIAFRVFQKRRRAKGAAERKK